MRENDKINVEDVDEEKEKEEKKKKKIKEVSHECSLVNKHKPIWMRKPEEMTKEEYSAIMNSSSISLIRSNYLHDKGSSVLNSWKMRIRIALDASRGIQYLHNYADSFIIHGDIKSSNILLDASWTARVSDFGWKFMRNKQRIIENTDPEYVIRGALSAESDVHGLGVVLFELLTGKRPTFVYGEDGGTLLSRKHLVDFAVTAISNGFLEKFLDQRAGQPDVNEAEAVKLVADTAIRCVNLKLKDRPTMADIVVRLERALAICDYDSIFRALVSNC
ncbi:putative serine/threonine-protein kinase-like protein CCR3 [Glycine max]|uniref:putative serine/threonine-protein kinase-like protein CCR3 n=1 Tax=Glycine max TaxID=3847 RepID=UPI001B356021|nr:putative serine/threonine-protein kinase-like protein CCR3 [Glycine max]